MGKAIPRPDYFHKNVRKLPNGCWEWTGSVRASGYGRMRVDRKTVTAHRYAYTLLVGQIPDGLQLDHLCHSKDLSCPGGKCDHRRCVNPDHLEPVLPVENVRRSARVRRTHCKAGHELVENNIYLLKCGRRRCRACALTAAAARNLVKPKRGNANTNKTHCLNGHPFAGENLYVTKAGSRQCRACNRAKYHRTRAARLAA